MRKKIVATTLVLAMMFATACGKENKKEKTTSQGEGQEVEASVVGQFCGVNLTYDPKEYLTLPDYSSIEVTEYEPTEDEVQQQLSKNVSSWTHDEEVDKDTVESGDICLIDFVGSVDGVEFEGGAGEDYKLEIGSNAFIPGFEDSLIGAKNKEKTTITVTFPEKYDSNPDLQGKEAQFDVTIKGIYKKVSYELNDESVAQNTEFSNVADYEAFVKGNLKKDALANQAWKALFEKCEFKETPDAAVEKYKKDLSNQMQQSLAMYGMTMDSYLETYGMTQEEFDQEMEETAINYVKQDILLILVALDNGIDITDEVMKDWAEENYASMGYDSAENLISYITEDNLKLYIISEKVLDLLGERVVEVPAAETEAETESESSASEESSETTE